MLHVGLGEIAGLTNLDFSVEQYWVLSKAAALSAVQWESINGLQKYRDTASSTSVARQGLLPVLPWGEAPRWRNSPRAAWQFSRYYKDIIIACKSEGCTQLRNLRAWGWVAILNYNMHIYEWKENVWVSKLGSNIDSKSLNKWAMVTV